MNLDNQVLQAAEAIRTSDALLITAGAGMGVDSGLPDFRGADGFWRAYPALGKLGVSFAEMANPGWFRKDPALAWAFYGHRLNLYRRTMPHAGFNQLLAIAKSKPHGYFVFTSNVDGHFQKAGFSESRVVECHGSIHHFQCIGPCSDEIWNADSEDLSIEETTFRAVEPLPKCRNCRALARPNILMFNDCSWLGHRADVQDVLFSEWLKLLHKASAGLTVIEFGAGTAVPTVRWTSERIANQVGGRLIRVNLSECDVPTGHIGLPLRAAEAIQRITS